MNGYNVDQSQDLNLTPCLPLLLQANDDEKHPCLIGSVFELFIMSNSCRMYRQSKRARTCILVERHFCTVSLTSSSLVERYTKRTTNT